MARVITQKTFDDAVKENIVEFEMEESEAKSETIQQFEAQGINLANIIKDLHLNSVSGEPILIETCKILNDHILNEIKQNDMAVLEKHLITLKVECNQSVPHRILADENGAKNILLKLAKEFMDAMNMKLLQCCLEAMSALVDKQPDIFDPELLKIIYDILKNVHDPKCICECLRIISKLCIMHENNRQNLMNTEILTYLKPLVKSDNPEIIKELCAVFRNLILDDDVRIEFGKAHEHAKTIAAEYLVDLTILLTHFKDNVDVICDLILTIASLTVRNELCLVVEEAGGLTFILDAMKTYMDSIKIGRESMKLLRALSGNDAVKVRIIQLNAAPLIECTLNIHKENEPLVKVALACISTLSLRSPENSKALYETGIAETIMSALKLHPTSKFVQRNGAWAIRNMVSRSRYQCDAFIQCGAEEVLNESMKTHQTVALDIKSALRDLGCKVNLKEEWTGKGEIRVKN